MKRKKMIIRSENLEDYSQISEVIISAFKQEDEVILVEELRKGPDFIRELSIVAIIPGTLKNISGTLYYPPEFDVAL